jgi:hypothetical protein
MYDMIVDGFGDNLFGSPNGFKKAYLFNDGTDPVQFKITTFEGDFDPATLRSTGGTTSGETTQIVEGTVDSLIVGFNVPLPSGSNNIGRVVVSEMPDTTVNFDELPAGDNHIGSVDVDRLPALSEGVSHIGSVGIDGGVTITSMPPILTTDRPLRESHQYFWGEIGATVTTFDMGEIGVNFISFIKNDGDDTVFITFGDTDITLPANQGAGLDMRIGLMAGESITDLPRVCRRVNFIRPTGAGAVRFLGI